jgi:hypothetical protein
MTLLVTSGGDAPGFQAQSVVVFRSGSASRDKSNFALAPLSAADFGGGQKMASRTQRYESFNACAYAVPILILFAELQDQCGIPYKVQASISPRHSYDSSRF